MFLFSLISDNHILLQKVIQFQYLLKDSEKGKDEFFMGRCPCQNIRGDECSCWVDTQGNVFFWEISLVVMYTPNTNGNS